MMVEAIACSRKRSGLLTRSWRRRGWRGCGGMGALMRSWSVFRYRLAKLQRNLDNIQGAASRQYAAALKPGTLPAEASYIMREVWRIEQRIKALQTNRLIELALKYQLPVPGYYDKETWEELTDD